MRIRSVAKILAVSAVCVSPFVAIAEDGGMAPGDAKIGTHNVKSNSFTTIDSNHDGFIDQKEAKKDNIDGVLFKKMDANSDGRISQSEFDDYLAKAKVDN